MKKTTTPLTGSIAPKLPNFIRQGTPFSSHRRRFKDGDKEEDDANEDEEGEGDEKAKPKKGEEPKYTQAELTAAIDKARRQEKGKVYDDLTKAQEAQKAAADEAAAFKKKVEELTIKVDSFKEASDAEGKKVDVEKLIEGIAEKYSARADKVAEERTAETEKKLAELTAKLAASEAKSLRAKLIAEAGGEEALVIDLVTGTTREEIEASIEKASAAFKKIEARFAKKKKSESPDDDDADQGEDDEEDDSEDTEDDKTQKRPPSELPEGSGGGKRGGGSSSDKKALEGAKAMTPSEYAANRSELLRKVAGGARPFSGGRRA